jgi:deoxycytidylate deaminase
MHKNRLESILNKNRKSDQRLTMIAIIKKGGNIISIGINDYFRLAYPFKDVNNYSKYSGLHAELDAINKCTKEQLKGSTIIVYGLSRTGKLPLSSRPCKSCYNAIKSVGIKKMIYYNKEGKEIRENV